MRSSLLVRGICHTRFIRSCSPSGRSLGPSYDSEQRPTLLLVSQPEWLLLLQSFGVQRSQRGAWVAVFCRLREAALIRSHAAPHGFHAGPDPRASVLENFDQQQVCPTSKQPTPYRTRIIPQQNLIKPLREAPSRVYEVPNVSHSIALQVQVDDPGQAGSGI